MTPSRHERTLGMRHKADISLAQLPWRARAPHKLGTKVAAGKYPAIRPLVNGASDPCHTSDEVMSLPTALPHLGGPI